jgi:hypothetical protein
MRSRWVDAVIAAGIVALLLAGVWALWWDDVRALWHPGDSQGSAAVQLAPQT